MLSADELDFEKIPSSTFVIYFGNTFANYLRDANEKKQIRGAFSQYLSPALVEQLAEDPDKLVLGGETKKMTFLFCFMMIFYPPQKFLVKKEGIFN